MTSSSGGGIYIFIDPFNRADSGVTTYVRLAKEQLTALGLRVGLIQISNFESIEDFRVRVKAEVLGFGNKIDCIEAPESLAATCLVPAEYPIHIRLHCSRSLGAAVQGLPYSSSAVSKEQNEISRARFLSSPSWASYFASCALFKFGRTPYAYPNPAPAITSIETKERKYDVAFVGRFQRLKGISYLVDIIFRLPHLRFAIVCPPTKSTILDGFKNVTFIDGRLMEKSEFYSLSAVVVVPSIFETASMVAIEALAFHCKVVLWQHLGVVEYFEGNTNLISVPSDDVASFVSKIEAAVKMPWKDQGNVSEKLNLSFRDGAMQLLSEGDNKKNIIRRPDENIENYLKELVQNQREQMKKKKSSSLVRKTQKLILHPIAFFRDSTEAKYLRRKMSERKIKKLVALKEEFKDHPDFRVERPPASDLVTESSLGADTVLDLSTKLPLREYCTTIEESGRIEIRVSESKPAGYSIAFMHHEFEDESLIQQIVDGLNGFDDFKYVNSSRMKFGRFNVSESQSALSIVNRIDVKNKNSLSLLNFIVLLNAPSNICNALRYAGVEQKIILIKTRNELFVDPDSVDGVISTDSQDVKNMKLRRVVIIDSMESVPLAMRRVLQEGFPKKRDMLLSLHIQGVCAFNKADFVGFDERHHQGILKIKKTDFTNSNTMMDVYEKISNSIVGIAVLESTYMRYRSLCEAVEAGYPATNLIEACLMDGGLFDVKEI
ncbi:glycosyltransferase [Pseudomonas fluorescens]|uniref:glycosyltransferase n=1 Tax=Pseudomonas fluorescens TaxID=294 RepID=UPI0018C28D86|nr:glycosyltransferase [Pseudomonas fluorescens]